MMKKDHSKIYELLLGRVLSVLKVRSAPYVHVGSFPWDRYLTPEWVTYHVRANCQCRHCQETSRKWKLCGKFCTN